jgi:hypothetical protein
MWTFLLLFTSICALFIYPFLIASSIQNDTPEGEKELRLRIKKVLRSRFGIRINPHRKIVSIPSGVTKWYIVRMEDLSSHMASDIGPILVYGTLLIQDHQKREYFVDIKGTTRSEEIQITVNAI